jgi:hypothetical protein
VPPGSRRAAAGALGAGGRRAWRARWRGRARGTGCCKIQTRQAL